MTANDGVVLVTGGLTSSGMTGINLLVDAGLIAASTWDAYGGLRETQGV